MSQLFSTSETRTSEATEQTTVVSSTPTCNVPKHIEYLQSEKCVTFNPVAHVKYIMHVNDYTDEEWDACFYDRSDIANFKADVKNSVLLLMLNDSNNDCADHDEWNSQDDDNSNSKQELCARGLEHSTRQGARQRRYNKAQALRIVLTEQDRQEDLDIDDPDHLAKLYKTGISEHAALVAYVRAIRDESYVRQMHLQEHVEKSKKELSMLSIPSCTTTKSDNKNNDNDTMKIMTTKCDHSCEKTSAASSSINKRIIVSPKLTRRRLLGAAA